MFMCFVFHTANSILKYVRSQASQDRTCKRLFTCVAQKFSFARKAKLEKDCFTWKKIKSMALSWEQLWCSLLMWLRKFAPTTRRSSQPWEIGRLQLQVIRGVITIYHLSAISTSKLIARKTISTTAFLLATSAQRDMNVNVRLRSYRKFEIDID